MTKTCKVLGVKDEIDVLDVILKLKERHEDFREWEADGWSVAGHSVDAAGILTVKLKYKDDKEPKMSQRFDLLDLSEIFCRRNLAWVKDVGVTKLIVL